MAAFGPMAGDHLEAMACYPIHFFYYQCVGVMVGSFHINAFHLPGFVTALCDQYIYSLQRFTFIPGGIIEGEISCCLISEGIFLIILFQAVRCQLSRQKGCCGPVEFVWSEEAGICMLTSGLTPQDGQDGCIDVPDLGLQKICDREVLRGDRICFRDVVGGGLLVVLAGNCQEGDKKEYRNMLHTAKLQHLRDCFDNTDLKAISFQVFLDGIGIIEGRQQLVAEFRTGLQA